MLMGRAIDPSLLFQVGPFSPPREKNDFPPNSHTGLDQCPIQSGIRYPPVANIRSFKERYKPSLWLLMQQPAQGNGKEREFLSKQMQLIVDLCPEM